MRTAKLVTLILAASTASVVTQSGPKFDVVSVKRNTTHDLGSNMNERPDGSFTMLNVPVSLLIGRAYPPAAPIDMAGLPDWATRERYDFSTASAQSRPTLEQRTAMLRAMLADRFKLAVHVETREQPAYDLVVARGDKRLGPNIKPSEIDCVAKAAADRAAAEAARAAGQPPPRTPLRSFDGSPPPCSVAMTGPRMEGDMTMETLARFLRPTAGRYVVDKTGLTGSYRVLLTFDRMAAQRGPDAAPAADAPSSVFTAVQEQLGLKLESSTTSRETLVIDHLERPTDN